MNKLVVAAAVAVAIALLGLPRVVGSMTEARVRERVAAIDATESASAELKSFERGWFRSTARIDLLLVPDDFAALAAQSPVIGNPFLGGAPLPVIVEFAHGPVAFLDGVHFGWSRMIARLDREAPGIAELESTLGVPYIFEFRGRTGYAGGLAFDADAPAFDLPIAETSIRFSGATLAGTFSGRHLDADANIRALELGSPTGMLTVSNVWVQADNELRSEYVMPGAASVTIERVTVTDAFNAANEPTFEVANLRVRSDSALDASDTLLDMRVDYEVESVRVDDNELTAATVGFALRNLDIAMLEAYSTAVNDAAANGGALDLTMLGPQLERALRAGPSMTVDPIRFSFEGEPFEGRVELTADAARLPVAGSLDIGNPLLVLGLLDAHAEARVSKPLALQFATLAAQMQMGGDPSVPPEQAAYLAEAQASLLLTMLTTQGIIAEDGSGGYRTNLDFTNGALKLNGNPLPFGLP